MQGTVAYQRLFHEASKATPKRLLELLESETTSEVHWPNDATETVKWDRGLELVRTGEPVIWRFGIMGFFRSKFPEQVRTSTRQLQVVDLDGHTFKFERKPGGWHGFCEETCLGFDRALRGGLLDMKLIAYQALDDHLL